MPERRLMIMRHAKSSWKTNAPSDRERPLNKRGKRDAPRVAQHLETIGWVPELVVTSDAKRARSTWKRMAKILDPDIESEVDAIIYDEGGLGAIRSVVAGRPPALTTIMVVGHNPGFESAVSRLSGRFITMTTGNVALLQTESETWDEAFDEEWSWELVAVVRPRELA